jgi:hypothetical protein
MSKAILLATGFTAMVLSPAVAQTALKVNQTADIQGIHTACGGASLDDQQAMAAQGFPVTLKLAGANGQWLGQETLTISGSGRNIRFGCEGPWVGMQLPAGRYKATAEIAGASPKTVSFTVGQGGAREVMIRFPEKKEAASPPPQPSPM